MANFRKLFLIPILLGLTAAMAATQQREIPDLEPDMTGPEYFALLKAKRLDPRMQDKDSETPLELDYIIKMGERNLGWISFMNKSRQGNDKLSFTKKENMVGYPVETPKIYNKELIDKAYQDFLSQLPKEMKDVLLGNGDYPSDPTLAVDQYLYWAWQADRLYQSAARWNMMKPYLGQLAARKYMDIRGYYFLVREQNLEANLDNWAKLDSATQQKYTAWLLGLCGNSRSTSQTCRSGLDNAIRNASVKQFFSNYVNYGKEIWEGFFDFYNPRPEAVWNSKDVNLMTIPFRDTGVQNVQEYLRGNIEDEWKWNGWQLKLDFTKNAPVHVKFVAGTTPHVNGVGGSEITMDANAPLTEWDVQWTIRHEFGHVLGFVDCYAEFYDSDIGAIVNYQMDITDLMCSRKGVMKQHHFDQLKEGYYKN